MLHRGSPTGGGAGTIWFDNVFPPPARQRDVSAVAADAVPGLLRGQNIAVLARADWFGKDLHEGGPPIDSSAMMNVANGKNRGVGEAAQSWLELERAVYQMLVSKSPPSSKDDDEEDKSVLNESDRGVYYAVLARLFSDIEAREDEDVQTAAGMAIAVLVTAMARLLHPQNPWAQR